jgi:ornithine cyclodeaminase/alanine dehydrogenase-like protein (mu-crystallin family)
MQLRRVFVWDVDESKARQLAQDMSKTLGLDVYPVPSPQQATRESHVIVTATTARTPFLTKEMVSRGAFVAAVGADNPEKSELAPELMAGAKVVVDLIGQAATMGDLHHAINAGAITIGDVHAELADVLLGRRDGRTSDGETIVFDSTGAAIQDVATAAAIWQRAVANNVGSAIHFGAL